MTHRLRTCSAAEKPRNVTALWLIPITICVLLTGALAKSTTNGLQLTEYDLKQYDGTDAERPIYLAINGTIFDVSASPAFYGPGGHYRK
jgi:hypothetical protein